MNTIWISLFILLAIVLWILPSKRKGSDPVIPGPYPWPLVGNNIFFMVQKFERACSLYNDWYGNIVQTMLNGEKVLIISDPELYKHIFLKRGENYLKRFTSKEVLDNSMRGGVGLVFNNNVENWNFHRRVFKRTVESMIPSAPHVVKKNINNLIKHWNQLIDANGGEVSLDVNEYTHRLSLDLIGELAFGLELNTIEGTTESNEISDAIYKGVNAWMESFLFFFLYPGYWKYIRSPTAEKFQKDLNRLAETEKKLFKQQKQYSVNENSFLRKLSTIVDDETGRKCKEEEVLQDIREMLAGGSDTSANTLTYCLYFLSKDEKCMTKLVEEVKDIDEEQILKGNEYIKNFKYLENVVNEAMRMVPAGPLIFRKAIEDDQLGPYFIPKDTNVICNIWHTMTSEKYWKNAKVFDPDRFNDLQNVDLLFEFTPFGKGRRGCPGRPLALLEMKIILGVMLKHYEYEFIGKEISPWWGLVEHSGEVHMKIKRRKPVANTFNK